MNGKRTIQSKTVENIIIIENEIYEINNYPIERFHCVMALLKFRTKSRVHFESG